MFMLSFNLDVLYDLQGILNALAYGMNRQVCKCWLKWLKDNLPSSFEMLQSCGCVREGLLDEKENGNFYSQGKMANSENVEFDDGDSDL